MENTFNSVMLQRPDGSWFDLTHDIKLTAFSGYLIPTMIMECYPGDKVKISNELLIRLQPLVAPAMQRMDAYIHSFKVPHRIIWEDFPKFLKGDAIALPFLTLDATDTAPGGLPDYVGCPPMTSTNEIKVNALPFVAIQRIFYEYYRDQNLSTMTDDQIPTALNGDNEAQKAMLLTIRKRSYKHDYFTSALPFTQKGTEATINFAFQDVSVFRDAPNPPTASTTLTGTPDSVDVEYLETDSTNVEPLALYAKTTDLNGTSFTINEFRLMLATQHWLERMAVGGTRMTEIIKAHFGVETSDKTLQRPEYIGGMKTPIVISEVLQTSESATTPQGNMSGHGIAASYNEDDDSYFCEEHGYIISMLSVMPIATYAQGLPRFLDWSVRNERNEWYWPEFAHLGEQAIKVREVYADVDATNQEEDWGYTARFNELRYMPSRIAGEFRSTLAHYSAARIFGTAPNLNEPFLTNVLQDVAKMFAVEPDPSITATQELIIHVLNKVSAFRLLPKYAQPELVG